jgi:hypothetical protein
MTYVLTVNSLPILSLELISVSSGHGLLSFKVNCPLLVHSEQKDDVNTSDQSEILNAENNGQLTLNDNSPCPEETEINSSDKIGKELTVNT